MKRIFKKVFEFFSELKYKMKKRTYINNLTTGLLDLKIQNVSKEDQKLNRDIELLENLIDAMEKCPAFWVCREAGIFFMTTNDDMDRHDIEYLTMKLKYHH